MEPHSGAIAHVNHGKESQLQRKCVSPHASLCASTLCCSQRPRLNRAGPHAWLV